MSRIELDEVFFDFMAVSERYIPAADQIEMCAELLRELRDKGHDIQVLYGHDEVVDEAFEELDDIFDYEEDEDEEY